LCSFSLAQDNKKDRRTNMRRLVVISNRKSKFIAASVGVVLSLTSIHLAATARIATLKREQEQLEKTAFSTQQSAVSQNASLNTLKPTPPTPLAPNSGAVTEPAANFPSAAKTSVIAGSSARPARQRQIVISIADRQLAVVDNGQVLKTYIIAVGARSTPSPDGDFVIVNHAKDPTYRHGDKEIAPGKDNPLGSRWMGLSLKGYGIHGTNVQSSIGKAASHGCFRMRKQDVEELYTLVQVGDTVTVRRERDAMIAQVFAAPVAPAAAKTLAAAAQNGGGEMQIASSEKATVETTQQ
jgi:lipoprotein-anchoring transpeptidase ErfK/SrfK